MNIRTKLTLRFITITAIIILLASILIYVFSADYRREDFYKRIQNKANNTAKLLLEVDEVDVNLLQKIEHDNPISLPHERISIYDYQNKLLFSTDKDKSIKIDENLIDRVRLEGEVRYTQNNFEVLGFLFKGQYDRFVVIAAATDIYGLKKLKNLRAVLLLVFLFSLAIASISGWLFAGKALQPIAKVVRRVDEISITSLNLRVDEGNEKDEIAKLAQTFNSMLTRLETSFITQKNFIANASHELRTPLTAITGQLEVVLLNARTQEEYVSVISSVLDDIRTLNSLSNRLLVLAQTSSEEREKRMTNLRVDDLLWETREELLKHNPTYKISIDIDEKLDDDERLTIKGDEQLIKTAFANLIENGCKYSSDTSIAILLTMWRAGVSIKFKDQGIGIPNEDLPNIYEPFYRGSNTKNIKGHGIGLSMVKGITKLHRGTLHITSQLEVGTTITLNFPTIANFKLNLISN